MRTLTDETREVREMVSLTGEIQPRYQADLGLRVNSKIFERPVDVGTQVKKGDLLARLDPQQNRQDLEVAKAEVAKGGCRGDAEPSPGIPAERTAKEGPHHSGAIRSGT
jgi:multidrug efflux pump subunit AcrA (membrane-fusion protein)